MPKEAVQARWVFAALAVQFFIPAFSYLIQPEIALQTMDKVGQMLGGAPYSAVENRGHLWHMLAVGNVMTLGFACALLAFDLERFYGALPSLVFLKGFSALFSLGLRLSGAPPLFLAVFVLDGATTVAMLAFAVRAHRAVRRARGELLAPARAWLMLWKPDLVLQGLERVRRAGLVAEVPTLEQVWHGVLRMWKRVLLHNQTVGTSTDPVRSTWRARLLQPRALRLPFLLWERVVAPLDFSGLVSTPERICRHVLGAHHRPEQLIYDLELISLHEGALGELERAAREVVDHDTPRTRWLKDLCVFEGYHQQVVDTVARFRRGEAVLTPQQAVDPDLTLSGFLAWCASS